MLKPQIIDNRNTKHTRKRFRKWFKVHSTRCIKSFDPTRTEIKYRFIHLCKQCKNCNWTEASWLARLSDWLAAGWWENQFNERFTIVLCYTQSHTHGYIYYKHRSRHDKYFPIALVKLCETDDDFFFLSLNSFRIFPIRNIKTEFSHSHW